MDQAFFTNLPSEIIINILSKIPIKTIIICKCVCKSWLELLESPEFAEYHLSRPVPDLIVYQDKMRSMLFQIYEFVDEVEVELEHHELHYNPVIKFDHMAFISHPYACIGVQGSANGLLFFREINTQPNALYICNPITREYIELPYPDSYQYPSIVTYGFGVSRVVNTRWLGFFTSVYVIQGDLSVGFTLLEQGHGGPFTANLSYDYNCRSVGAFLNGNLHWLVGDLNDSPLISCFDLETELFDAISPPPSLPERSTFLGDLLVFEDFLCLCDNTSDNEIVMWIMKEYEVEKSWLKEYVISKLPDLAGESYS